MAFDSSTSSDMFIGFNGLFIYVYSFNMCAFSCTCIAFCATRLQHICIYIPRGKSIYYSIHIVPQRHTHIYTLKTCILKAIHLSRICETRPYSRTKGHCVMGLAHTYSIYTHTHTLTQTAIMSDKDNGRREAIINYWHNSGSCVLEAFFLGHRVLRSECLESSVATRSWIDNVFVYYICASIVGCVLSVRAYYACRIVLCFMCNHLTWVSRWALCTCVCLYCIYGRRSMWLFGIGKLVYLCISICGGSSGQ